jgi:ADP-heptose:LPS heptosyltransferase
MPTRGLIVRLGALGDTLLLEPVLAALRAGLPGLDWELLGTPPQARLLQHHLALIHDAGEARFSPLFVQDPLNRDLEELLRRFARALVLSSNESLRQHLSACIPETLSAAPLPAPEDPISVIDYSLETLRPWPIDLEGARRTPQLAAWQPAEWAVSSDEIVLAPGAGSAAKRWPLDRWGKLAQELQLPRARWTILLGPAEADLREEARSLAEAIGAEVLDTPELESLPARLARSRLFVGNDSGPTHLAAATGCPTLALFGPHSQPRWEPRGARVMVVRAYAGWESAAPEAVARRATELVEVDP